MEIISSVESKTAISPCFIKKYFKETKSPCELESGLITVLLSNGDMSILKSDAAFLKVLFFGPKYSYNLHLSRILAFLGQAWSFFFCNISLYFPVHSHEIGPTLTKILGPGLIFFDSVKSSCIYTPSATSTAYVKTK